MSYIRNIKSWFENVAGLPQMREAIEENRKLIVALQADSRVSADLIRSFADAKQHGSGASSSPSGSDGILPSYQELKDSNDAISAELDKFKHWLESINVVSSKTTYGEMLISSYDRVQCSRAIPEVNYEEHLLSDIIDFLSQTHSFSCDTFIDIGSNIGTQSVFMLKSDLARQVIAVEPDPTNYKILRSNFILNDVDHRAVAINSALGDFDGEVEFELSKDNMGDHRVRLREYEGWVQNEQYRDVIKVRMQCPKSALGSYDLDYSKALVWLDAQGLEGHILTSFLKDGQNVQYFVCEYWPYGIECVQGKEKFFDILEQCEEIYDIRNMTVGNQVSLESLRSYYEKSVVMEANHKVYSLDLLCIVKASGDRASFNL